LRAYLGLGSNVGDRLSHLRTAVATLRSIDPALAVSSLYETAPVGGPPGQTWYLNLVVGMRTRSSPRQLLDLAHELERCAGRVRTVRFGPRTLDVDVLLVGELSVDEDDLVVPHPRMWERAFVLAPLEELDPSLVPAGWRERLGAAAGEDAVRRVGSLDLT
jgi:2-amino-4-hydroxy-6-hydroxymethyldihydropteridine diphosphokinase